MKLLSALSLVLLSGGNASFGFQVAHHHGLQRSSRNNAVKSAFLRHHESSLLVISQMLMNNHVWNSRSFSSQQQQQHSQLYFHNQKVNDDGPYYYYPTQQQKPPHTPLHRLSARRQNSGELSATTPRYTILEEPSIVYSDNHLLVVNKPPGWHSVPNPIESSKCLLSKLKDMGLGGGSQKDFLLPLHRIDQPCSGLLLFGKTSKSATRITTLWKKKQVQKFYLVAVPSCYFDALQRNSFPLMDDDDDDDIRGNNNGGWFRLQGILEGRDEGNQRSVRIRPMTKKSNSHQEDKGSSKRILSVDWKAVNIPRKKSAPSSSSISSNNNPHSMLLVQTSDGARHVVRALLAQIGKCPIQGDLRYGGKHAAVGVLPDQSVALHAYRIHLDEKLKLGTLDTFEFEAPFPSSWKSFFGFAPTKSKIF